jgi:hypothetical protein
MKIGEYLEQNKTELWNELIKHELIDMDDVEDEYITIDNLDCKQTGCYEGKGDDLIETDEICGIMEGMDLSFDKKYVKAFEYEASEFMIEVNGKKVYGLSYNV